jgi:hypothetical protein
VTFGIRNVAVGMIAGCGITTGCSNTFVGGAAGTSVSTGCLNTLIGSGAGLSITTGCANVVLGSNNGSTIATASCNIIISDGVGTARISVDSTGNTTLTGNNVASNTTTGALIVPGGVGVGGSMYVNNRIGYVNNWPSQQNTSVVFQCYNTATTSLDTIFG